MKSNKSLWLSFLMRQEATAAKNVAAEVEKWKFLEVELANTKELLVSSNRSREQLQLTLQEQTHAKQNFEQQLARAVQQLARLDLENQGLKSKLDAALAAQRRVEVAAEMSARSERGVREEQRLQVRHHRSVQILKILTAVSDHRRAKRLERLVTDLDWSRDMKLQVRHKAQRAYFEAPSQIKQRVSISKKLAAPPILTHNAHPLCGEVAEWLKAHAWKA